MPPLSSSKPKTLHLTYWVQGHQGEKSYTKMISTRPNRKSMTSSRKYNKSLLSRLRTRFIPFRWGMIRGICSMMLSWNIYRGMSKYPYTLSSHNQPPSATNKMACSKSWTKSPKTPKSTPFCPTSRASSKTSWASLYTTNSPSVKATKPLNPPPTTSQSGKARENTKDPNSSLEELR